MTKAENNDPATVRLPPRLNSAAAIELLSAVRKHQGKALALDASDVDMIGAQCVQILISAHRNWCAQGTAFEVRNLSSEMSSSLGILGLTADQIGAGENANGA